jgi:hypothetical protein
VSASRHVQDLDPVAFRRPLWAASATLPEREPTFDELVHGDGEHAGRARRPWSGMFGHRRAARARAAR